MFGAAAHRPAPDGGGSSIAACSRGDYLQCCVAMTAWAGSKLVPTALEVMKEDSVLLFVDSALVGRWKAGDDAASLEGRLEDLLNAAWSHLRGVPPMLRGRDSFEDRLVLAAMRFHRQPQLALVLGCSVRQGSISEALTRAVSEIVAAVEDGGGGGGGVFVYATTNPRICAAFGITADTIPTVALRAGKKLFRLAPGAPFEAATVVRFVNTIVV